MHIHFVCRGNAYRSRLAEAYLRSKQLQSVMVSSSGIEAAGHAHTVNGPITWVAQRILQRNGLVPFMSFHPTQTTHELLKSADLVIFMEEAHEMFAREQLGYTGKRFQVWHISDIVPGELDVPPDALDAAIIRVSEATFTQIKKNIDILIVTLPTLQLD